MTQTLTDVKRDYAPGEERPLGSFLGLMGIYAGAVATGGALLRRRGVRPPERVSLQDVAVTALATHRLSRLIAKDPVTSPLRAPFVRLEGTTGPAELKEEVRGTGAQHAIGELLTCPFCVGQWVATGFAFGLVAAPRVTRLTATVFSAVALADFLHVAYDRLQPGD